MKLKHLSIRILLVALMLIIVVAANPIPNHQLITNANATGITRVQGNARGTFGGSGTSFTVTMSSTPTDGNTIILGILAAVGGAGASVSSVSQTGVTWSGNGNGKQIGYEPGNGYADTEIWLGSVGTDASTVITVNLSAYGIQAVADACEYSGLASSSTVLDKTATNYAATASSTPDTGTTLTTTNAGELWIGITTVASGISSDQTSPTNGFSLLDGVTYFGGSNYYSLAYLEKIVSSTGTANSGASLPSARYWTGIISTFKANPASASPSDSLSQSDGVVRNFVGARAATDSGSVTDLVGRLRNVPDVLSETMGWADTLIRLFTGKKTLTDTLTDVDSILRVHGLSTSQSETLSISDVLGARYGYIRPLIEQILATDTLSAHGVIGRVLSDTLVLTDWLPQPTHWSLHAVSIYQYEFMTISDLLTREQPVVRALTDQFSLSDVFSRDRAVTRTMNDVLGIVDSLIHLGPPAMPTLVSATQNPVNPQGSIDLTWTETDTYAGMTYYIDKSIDSATWVSAGTSATTSYTASGLTSGYGWYFRIRAYNGQYSAYSSTVLGVTGTIPVSGLGGSQPTASYALVIKIVDLNSTPVQGASVTVGSWSLLSDSTGIANFGTPQGGTYTISISASTCQATNQTINLNSNHDLSNPLQVSLTCGTQQATSTGTQYSLAQIENNLLVPVLGFSLLAIAGVAYFSARKSKVRKKKGNR